MHISIADQVNDELQAVLKRLIPQLTTSNPAPTYGELSSFQADPSSHLILARWPDQEGPVVGMLTLVVYRVPTGIRAVIEDVVVDRAHRGKGVGEALLKEGLQRAAKMGARAVSLTSNPRRVEANRLYRKMGFALRETNVYQYRLRE